MYLIKNRLSILVHTILVQAIIVQAIISNKLSILNNKLGILSNKLISSSNKLSIISSKLCILVQAILVQAILVQRYSCAPNILYYIKYSKHRKNHTLFESILRSPLWCMLEEYIVGMPTM